jgi:hypothetical protein
MEIAAEDAELETELLLVLLEEVERTEEELVGDTVVLLKVLDFAKEDMLEVVECDEVTLDDNDSMLLLRVTVCDEEIVLDAVENEADELIEDDILLSAAVVRDDDAVLLLGLTDCDADVLEEDDVDELPTVDERSTVVEVILSVML